MKKNVFKNFLWEKDANGDYTVTNLYTGKFVTAIKVRGNNKYRIMGNTETEKNYYGQDIPKEYTKFDVMNYVLTL